MHASAPAAADAARDGGAHATRKPASQLGPRVLAQRLLAVLRMHNAMPGISHRSADNVSWHRRIANRLAIRRCRVADFWRRGLPIALACTPALGLAAPIAVQPLQALRAFAVQTVRAAAPPDATLVANADRLDPRLRLPACRGALRADPPNLLAATTVVMVPVTCTAGADWTVRVPVAIQLFRKVLVATQAIGRGSELEPGEFTAVSRNVATLGYGYLVDADRLAGRRIEMAIVAGTVITPSMLAPEHTIRSGQTVSIVAHVGSVEVRAAGVAMAGGGPGDVIRVKSTGCDCLIQGTIQPDDTVAAVP